MEEEETCGGTGNEWAESGQVRQGQWGGNEQVDFTCWLQKYHRESCVWSFGPLVDFEHLHHDDLKLPVKLTYYETEGMLVPIHDIPRALKCAHFCQDVFCEAKM